MSTPTDTMIKSMVAPFISRAEWQRRIKEHVTPYHIVLAGLIGAISIGLAVLIGVLLLISTNFNILDAIE